MCKPSRRPGRYLIAQWRRQPHLALFCCQLSLHLRQRRLRELVEHVAPLQPFVQLGKRPAAGVRQVRSARPGGSLPDKTPPSGYALAAVQDVQGRLSQPGLCCKPLARASGSLQRPAPQQRQAATAGGAAPGDATRHREACAVAGPRHGLPRLPLYRRQLVEANGSAQGTQLAPEVLHPQLPRILGDGAIVLRGVCLGWRWVYVCVCMCGGGGGAGGGGEVGGSGGQRGKCWVGCGVCGPRRTSPRQERNLGDKFFQPLKNVSRPCVHERQHHTSCVRLLVMLRPCSAAHQPLAPAP